MDKNIALLVRLIIFLAFLGSSLWTAHHAYELNSSGFGWLSFGLFVAAATTAQQTFERT